VTPPIVEPVIPPVEGNPVTPPVEEEPASPDADGG